MLRKNARSTVIALMVVLVSIVGANSAEAQQTRGSVEAKVSQLNIVENNVPTGPAKGGVILTRDDRGVTAQVSVADLDAGHVYTMWWVVFNKPRACSTDPCSTGDPNPDGVELSILWGNAFIAGNKGIVNVAARLDKGETPGIVLRGNGLRRVRSAEIHVILADHGRADRNTIVAEMQSPMPAVRGAIFKAE